MIACLLIIGHLCVHDIESVQVRGGTTISVAEMKGRSFEATLILGTDGTFTPDWRRMNVACTSACIAYFKHCEQDGAAYFCDYSYSQAGDRVNQTIRISASGREGVLQAEREFSIILRTGWMLGDIPLTKFTIESSEKNPPACPYRYREPESACWPHP